MSENPPVQHTPKHLEGGVFDERHPAASAFAPVQPGAGVVSDDADDKGQNLAGGPTATEAAETYADQKEVLAEQHADSLAEAAGLTVDEAPKPVVVDGDVAKPADSKPVDAKPADAKPAEKK